MPSLVSHVMGDQIARPEISLDRRELLLREVAWSRCGAPSTMFILKHNERISAGFTNHSARRLNSNLSIEFLETEHRD